MVKERERQGKIGKLWETKSRRTPEHGWASSEDEEDITATGLTQGKGKPKDSTTGQPEEAEDGEGESLSAMPAIGRKECPEELNSPIADMEERLPSKAPDLTGQNATRHQAVLRFPYCQKTQSMALQVARCFNRGRWFAYELELSWKKTGRFQPENKGGKTMAHR
ncbi:hypothetical protein V8E54_006265 [Elaphomyces granulatus]